MQYFSSSFFADADSSYEEAHYVIFGIPYDGTTSYISGTRDGPKAIREVSYNFETYIPEFDLDMTDIPVKDMGDLEPSSVPEMVVAEVESAVRDFLEDGKFPIMLGGEHSATVGAVRAIKPDCYIVCDAHLDLRDEYGDTPYNHACATRRVLESGVSEIYIIGGRSGPRDEFDLAKEDERIHLYTSDEVRRLGISSVLKTIEERISGKKCYLSIDADAIDCCLTPGLGTPEPFGLTPLDIKEVVDVLGKYASGFDYMEVCPIDAGQTAAVASKIIREFIAVNRMSSEKKY
ncbi:agmatinase [Methanoplanus sp. FWC-SCC4]|uniref:Agmatinase n=1 Tax=Methanochimaera problematica TaxID=2609417 RepID=A0AA97FDS6_9EURY|nr:agmatinase [Methanoplanus sp. FWC-SCC4]WOF16193.1 agmatinase [Methanoplanus sp. FWC-SCC4]